MAKYFNMVWIVCALMLTAVSGQAAQSKGYKIVLASFPEFGGAKKALSALESKLEKNDLQLQDQYGFEFVARPSGRAFIVGIEPIESKEAVSKVMKRFKRLYPSAYSDKYYGPTQGSVFIEHAKTPVVEEKTPEPVAVEPVKNPDENLSLPEEKTDTSASENGDQPVEPVKASSDAEEKNDLLSYVKVIAALSLLVLIVMTLRHFSRTSVQKMESHAAKAAVNGSSEMGTSEDTATQSGPSGPIAESLESVQHHEETKEEEEALAQRLVDEPEPDIFYRLTQNLFFTTLLHELKEAADNKDAQRCRDLMDEVNRYQKNFKPSPVIAKMNEMTDAKVFAGLSALIASEIS